MVAWAGGYYGEPFRGKRGVTQGEPLLPIIFNVVVDAVVRHWESLVAEGDGGDSSDDNMAQPARRTIRECDDGRQRTEEEHTWLKVKAAFFYVDDGMVASTDP